MFFRFSVLLIIPLLIIISCEDKKEKDITFVKTFGGSLRDFGRSIQETINGGYIITGYTYSYGNGESDVLLIKTDSRGYEMWSKTFGGGEKDYGSLD